MENAIVLYKSGTVHFNNYNEILDQAKDLAEHLKGVEVNEENIKLNKKLVAEVRKKVDELDTARKGIKKEVLKAYTEFEDKVKTITGVVSEAENVIRSQVKTLEEKERLDKQMLIEDLFYKRLKLYPSLAMVFCHEHFIEPRHLNKSMSMDKIEKEMVSWFERTKKAVSMIGDLEDCQDILVEYLRCGDAVKAIETVKERRKAKEKINEASGITTFTIQAKTPLEEMAIENILTTNGIQFKKS